MKNLSSIGTSVGENPAQDFADSIKDDKQAILKWAKKEMKCYQELIAIIEKQIVLERKLPKVNKRKYKPSQFFI